MVAQTTYERKTQKTDETSESESAELDRGYIHVVFYPFSPLDQDRYSCK